MNDSERKQQRLETARAFLIAMMGPDGGWLAGYEQMDNAIALADKLMAELDRTPVGANTPAGLVIRDDPPYRN
ncbi:MAG TPA: hypothetical protein VFC78_21230 [Tepidisphaeraceae bacterium]|nr:hypothetical protein [Tepidisphaeraceae bacterium]